MLIFSVQLEISIIWIFQIKVFQVLPRILQWQLLLITSAKSKPQVVYLGTKEKIQFMASSRKFRGECFVRNSPSEK